MDVLAQLEELRAELRRIRKQAGKSQGEIGEALGFAGHTDITKMETGKDQPTAGELLKWADVCGYTVKLVPQHATGREQDAARLLALLEDADRWRMARIAEILLTLPDAMNYIRDLLDKDIATYETLLRQRQG